MRKKRGEASKPEDKVAGRLDVDQHLQLLRTWIEKSGKALQEVAGASKMSVDDLSATLRGERPLLFGELHLIIVALGKKPRDFFLVLCGEHPAPDTLWPPTTSSTGSGGD